MRAAVCFVLLLLLAGCGSKGSTDGGVGGGRIDQQVLAGTATGSGAPKAGFGIIEGTVVDDGNLTLPGASVSLLGTQSFAATGKTGSFRFADIKPDIYGLRVQASGFQVYEGKVTVEAGKVTKATVTMLPADGRGPGYRPHLHDYWGRDSEVLLMDDDVDLRTPPPGSTSDPNVYSAQVTAEFGNSNGTFQVRVPTDRSDGRPPIVLPGTREMRVTITWDQADVQVPQFGLRYATAASSSVYNHPHSSGDPYVITLAPGDADVGHQAFTLWTFSVYTGNVYTQPSTFSPSLIRGPIHIKMALEKGAVVVDPPHPDRWQGNTSMVIRPFGTVANPNGLAIETYHIYTTILPAEKQIVAPGTNHMHLKFSWTDTQNQQLNGNWGLRMRTGDMPPTTPLAMQKVLEPSKTTGNVKEFDVDVAPQQTDAFYQTKSNWAFTPYDVDYDSVAESVTDAYHTFQLEITITKDPAFT